jgi:alpha-ribazole phosphatase
LTLPKHAFWPLGGHERPPGGETMTEVIERVGAALERLALQHDQGDVVIVSHGGAIRAAVAHCLRIGPDNALHLAVQNLSLTRLEKSPDGWRVVCVNELPGY